jgi:putative Mg2+ transporter-C (MgtC) family protein
MYMEAVIATVLLLVALQIVGAMEGRLGWKRYPMMYEVRADVGVKLGRDTVGAEHAETMAERVEQARHRMMAAVLKVMDAAGQRLHVVDRENVAGLERICFSVLATRRLHSQVLEQLRASDATDQVVVFEDMEDD